MSDLDVIMSEFKKLNETFDEKISSLKQSIIDVPEIIDTKEICIRLHLTEPSLIKLRKKKKIPFFYAGNGIRYNWPSVVKALEKSKP